MKVKKGDQRPVARRARTGARTARSTRVDPPRPARSSSTGVNVAKKHQQATRATMQGGIMDKEMPIPASNVAILAGDGKPTKVGFRFDDQRQQDPRRTAYGGGPLSGYATLRPRRGSKQRYETELKAAAQAAPSSSAT